MSWCCGGKPVSGTNEVVFVHDSRLRWPSLQYFTKEQIDGLLVSLESRRTCVLLAEDGMPYSRDEIERFKTLLKPDVFMTLPGSHHFHMDPEHSKAVFDAVYSFLDEE